MDGCIDPFNGIHPCGKCPWCLKIKAWRWCQKLRLEQIDWPRSWFLSLTYAKISDIHDTPKLVYPDFQKYMKRLRKHTKCRYFVIYDRGSKHDRPHWHAIVYAQETLTRREVEKHWVHGFKSAKLANLSRIRYVSDYVRKGTFRRSSQSLGKASVRSIGVGLSPKIAEAFPEAELRAIDGITLPGRYRMKLRYQKNDDPFETPYEDTRACMDRRMHQYYAERLKEEYEKNDQTSKRAQKEMELWTQLELGL